MTFKYETKKNGMIIFLCQISSIPWQNLSKLVQWFSHKSVTNRKRQTNVQTEFSMVEFSRYNKVNTLQKIQQKFCSFFIYLSYMDGICVGNEILVISNYQIYFLELLIYNIIAFILSAELRHLSTDLVTLVLFGSTSGLVSYEFGEDLQLYCV